MKITKATLKQIGQPNRETWIWDSTMPGFGLRVWPSGRAVYVLRYRTDAGTQRKITLGDARSMHPEEARDRARLAIVASKDGKDPQGERRAKRHTETVKTLFDAYMEYQSKRNKPNSFKQLNLAVKNHIIPNFGTIKLTELRHDIVAQWHSKQTTRFAANQAVRHLSAALTWAADVMDWIPKNPLRNFRYFAEKRRQMILKPEQLRDLIATIEAHPPYRWAAPYLLKLLLVTGLRLREWSQAEWWQYSDKMGTLYLPDEKSKTGERTVQLGNEAIVILRQIKSHPLCHERWIFPNRNQKGPISHPARYWRAITERAGVPKLRVHDLRHTFATYSLMAGATVKETSEMLGHRNLTTTSRYLGIFDDTVKQAQSRTARAILNVAMTGQLPDTDGSRREPVSVSSVA